MPKMASEVAIFYEKHVKAVRNYPNLYDTESSDN